jgi:actin-related protein 10
MKPYGEVRYIWDKKYINRDELYLIQCRFLSTIYLQYLMINPRDYRVIVVESLFTPSKFRETLARVLFVRFSVPNVCFLPHHLACLFTLGTLTALVIDIGYNESSVVPVYEGMPLINSTMVTTTATTSIYSSLRQLLLEHGKVEDQVSGKDVPISSVDITQSLLVDIVSE